MTAPLKKKHIEKTLTEAMALHNAGQLDAAAALYNAILGAEPKEPNALLNLSTLHIQRGEFAAAEPLLKRMIVAQPKLGYAHFALGNMFAKMQRHPEAAASYSRAITLEPGNPAYHYNLGIALDAVGRYEEAIASYDRAVTLQPTHYEAMVNHANNLFRLKRFTESLAAAEQIIAANPTLPLAYIARGNALGAMEKKEAALADYNKAIELDPTLDIAHNNRGSILEKQGGMTVDDALASYEKALTLNPRYADAHNNRATALNKLARYEEALASCEQAIALNPTAALLYDTRGNALVGLGRFAEALADYDRAMEIKPDLDSVYWNKALLSLLLGDLSEGLRLYEWRWKTDYQREDFRPFPQPMWLGEEPLDGKTIFVWHEQGFGDHLQLFRYISLLVARGAKVILETPPTLMPIIAPSLPPNVTLVKHTDPLLPFDYQIPLMSLQHAFRTTVDTVPGDVPYLTVPPEKQAKWQQLLGPKSRPRIGLVWSGAAAHTNDANRSIPLALLEPLLKQNFEFHSLQKEVRERDEPYIKLLHDHRNDIADFADTAALIAQLDLVISVDTSVAHLAGALGRPLWVLLPQMPDYRWLLDRTDSIWYPTARLFRQSKRDDWPNTIEAVIEALNEKHSSHG